MNFSKHNERLVGVFISFSQCYKLKTEKVQFVKREKVAFTAQTDRVLQSSRGSETARDVHKMELYVTNIS